MVPMIVLFVSALVARIFVPWKDAARIGLAVMLVFTAVSHFAPSISRDLAAMIPPPFTGAMWVIYVTGVLEIAGAIGLLTRRYRRVSAICLVLLLIALFPANVYAAMAGVPLRGEAATPLWLRTPMQIFWIALLWWTSIRRSLGGAPASSPALAS
jgi:uncharacterized membrane protein